MTRSIIRAICALSLAALLGLLGGAVARADGGAPQLAYVAGSGQGVSVIDIAKRQVTNTVGLSGSQGMVLLSPDGSTLYVTQPESGRLSVLAPKSGRIFCSASLPGQPDLLALSIDYSVLYVAGSGDTKVRAVNPATCAVERVFETGQPVKGLAVAASPSPQATPQTPNEIWASGGDRLSVFAATGVHLGTVPISGEPLYLSIPQGSFTAYVDTKHNGVLAVDMNSYQVLHRLLEPGQYGPMDYDALTGEIFVPDMASQTLDVITPITAATTRMPQEPGRVLSLSGTPTSVAITSDGQLGFVALTDGQVLMLDIPGHTTIASIPISGTPRFIITGLYPPTLTSAVSPPDPSAGVLALPMVLLGGLVALGMLILVAALALYWQRARRRGCVRSDRR